MLTTAQYISYSLGIYLAFGALYGLFFVTKGVRDEPIIGAAITLRLMLFSAVLFIWPLLIWRKS